MLMTFAWLSLTSTSFFIPVRVTLNHSWYISKLEYLSLGKHKQQLNFDDNFLGELPNWYLWTQSPIGQWGPCPDFIGYKRTQVLSFQTLLSFPLKSKVTVVKNVISSSFKSSIFRLDSENFMRSTIQLKVFVKHYSKSLRKKYFPQLNLSIFVNSVWLSSVVFLKCRKSVRSTPVQIV